MNTAEVQSVTTEGDPARVNEPSPPTAPSEAAPPADGALGDGEARAPRVVRVAVRATFEPETLVIPAHAPVRILFTRYDSSHCTDEVVFPEQGVGAVLVRGAEVAVDLPALEPGEYRFECGLRMLRGRLVAHRPPPVVHRIRTSASPLLHGRPRS